MNPRPPDYESEPFEQRFSEINRPQISLSGKYIITEKEIKEYLETAMAGNRVKTVRDARSSIYKFLTFGNVKHIKRDPKTKQYLEIESEIDYNTIIKYKQYANSLKSKTPLTYVKYFLDYLAKKYGDPTLREWKESLKWEKKKERKLYAEEGEKADIEPEDIINDLKIYYNTIFKEGNIQRAKPYLRNLVMVLFAETTGIRPYELDRITSELLKEGLEKGYFELPAKLTKTKANRVIPIHPAIREWLILLLKLYPNNPFSIEKFKIYRARADAKVRLNQIRNFSAKYFTAEYGLPESYRIAIMGHDIGAFEKRLNEVEDISAEEKKVSKIYQKYSKEEIVEKYLSTVGRRFNPVPSWLKIQKIKEKFNL